MGVRVLHDRMGFLDTAPRREGVCMSFDISDYEANPRDYIVGMCEEGYVQPMDMVKDLMRHMSFADIRDFCECAGHEPESFK